MDITKSHIVPLIADEEKIDYFINRQWDLAPFKKGTFSATFVIVS
jgi:hypothetical protein